MHDAVIKMQLQLRLAMLIADEMTLPLHACRPAALSLAQPAPKGAEAGALTAAEGQHEAGAYERMAAASGWDPGFQHRRMVQMAYSSLFAPAPKQAPAA